ncbi:MAG: hypothetical protein HWE35_08420 [Rhodobacteraceae bacterium]|nr:hypothetical protein [Paracoccaceae bacterium]
MKLFFTGGAVAFALTATSLSAAPLFTKDRIAGLGPVNGEQNWLVKGGNGKSNGHGGGKGKLRQKGNGNGGSGNAHAGSGKPEHAGGPKPRANSNDARQAPDENGHGANGRRAFTMEERAEEVSRIISARAPAGRDMTRVLGAAALALATPQLVVTDIPEDELITFINCPPGLAKKDPPCVPPGLAKKGVTYGDWASYDRDGYDAIWVERRDKWLHSAVDADPASELLLLQSDQIATLFNLGPAPNGHRYALIDGMPVLLDKDDYTSLLLVNQIAQVPDMMAGVPIAPTAALTQDELINLYRLPQPGAGEHYAVLNGQVVKLNDSEFELLQMLRIARAVL